MGSFNGWNDLFLGDWVRSISVTHLAVRVASIFDQVQYRDRIWSTRVKQYLLPRDGHNRFYLLQGAKPTTTFTNGLVSSLLRLLPGEIGVVFWTVVNLFQSRVPVGKFTVCTAVAILACHLNTQLLGFRVTVALLCLDHLRLLSLVMPFGGNTPNEHQFQRDPGPHRFLEIGRAHV